MLKVTPSLLSNIERMSVRMRNEQGLNRCDARMLHIVDAEQVNMPERLVRYNLRQKDGTIKKITMFENFIREEILKNMGNGYKKVSTQRIDV